MHVVKESDIAERPHTGGAEPLSERDIDTRIGRAGAAGDQPAAAHAARRRRRDVGGRRGVPRRLRRRLGAERRRQDRLQGHPQGPARHQLNFSNWPLYIDVSHGKHPTLEKFQKQFGVKVKYTEEINDNTEFFGKVRQQLANGNSGGRDIIVMTDWMARQDDQARLHPEAEQGRAAERAEEPHPGPPAHRLRPQPRLLGAVAERADRADRTAPTRWAT